MSKSEEGHDQRFSSIGSGLHANETAFRDDIALPPLKSPMIANRSHYSGANAAERIGYTLGQIQSRAETESNHIRWRDIFCPDQTEISVPSSSGHAENSPTRLFTNTHQIDGSQLPEPFVNPPMDTFAFYHNPANCNLFNSEHHLVNNQHHGQTRPTFEQECTGMPGASHSGIAGNFDEIHDWAFELPTNHKGRRVEYFQEAAVKNEEQHGKPLRKEYFKKPDIKDEEKFAKPPSTDDFKLPKLEDDDYFRKLPAWKCEEKVAKPLGTDNFKLLKLEDDEYFMKLPAWRSEENSGNSVRIGRSFTVAATDSLCKTPDWSPDRRIIYQQRPVFNMQEPHRAEFDISKLGKASPFSSQSQDGESESTCKTESESNEDENQSVESTCPAAFNKREQNLYKQILLAFWKVWNQKYLLVLLGCIKSTPMSATACPGSTSIAQSQSMSFAVTSSAALHPCESSFKRKRTDDNDDDDNLPPGDRRQGPKRPKGDITPATDERLTSRFACPFRKHSPRKYNMHHPTWKACAISSFESVSRTKEHLYRKHNAPIQCIRCWIFFKNQDDLNIHLSVIDICEVRAGQPIEGITPEMVVRLKNRKRSSIDQTEEDRWRRMYAMIFPNTEIPSPFFEPVLDDLAQFNDAIELPIGEFMRQRLPQFLSRRLEVEIFNMDLDEDTGALNERSRLREIFVTRIPILVAEAVEDVSSAYQPISFRESSMLNVLPTPTSSYRSDLPNTALHAVSQAPSHTISLQESYSSGLQMADHLSSQGPQYFDTQVSEAELRLAHGHGTAQMGCLTSLLNSQPDVAWNPANAITRPPELGTGGGVLNVLAQKSHNDDIQPQDPALDGRLPFDWEVAFDEMCGNSQGDASEGYFSG